MNYKTTIDHFKAQGLSENSLVTFQQLKDILDRLTRKTTNQPNSIFRDEVAKQLWGQCDKNVNGQITIYQYAHILVEAKEILQQRINSTKENIRSKISKRQEIERQILNARSQRDQVKSSQLIQQLQNIQYELSELEEDYRYYETDFKAVTAPFTTNNIFNSIVDDNPNINNGSIRRQSQFFMKRSSTALTSIFALSVLLLLIEMLIMLQKHHFLGILSALFILAIFSLNYFNKPYVMLLLGTLATSILLDTFWFLTYFGQYWTPRIISQRPRLFPGFLKLILLGVVVVISIKVILFLILLGYINVQEQGDVDCLFCTISVSPTQEPFSKKGKENQLVLF